MFPALHALVAHWAPPAEKGKFVSALLGGAIGTVVTWSLTGPLIENLGWDYAFYVPGKLFFNKKVVLFIMLAAAKNKKYAKSIMGRFERNSFFYASYLEKPLYLN